MPSRRNHCSPWVDAGLGRSFGCGKSKTAQEWQKYTSPVASKSAAAICLGRMNGCFFSDFGEFSTLKA
jgi:hypothetical protein